MKDIELLIETAYRLSNTLSIMAENEATFGWEVGRLLETMAYDQYVIANNIKQIKETMVGGKI